MIKESSVRYLFPVLISVTLSAGTVHAKTPTSPLKLYKAAVPPATARADFYAAAGGRIDAITDQALRDYGIPGAVVCVEVPGVGTWLRARGKSDLAEGRASPYLTKLTSAPDVSFR